MISLALLVYFTAVSAQYGGHDYSTTCVISTCDNSLPNNCYCGPLQVLQPSHVKFKSKRSYSNYGYGNVDGGLCEEVYNGYWCNNLEFFETKQARANCKKVHETIISPLIEGPVSYKWSGVFEATKSEYYSFRLNCSDACAMILGGKTLVTSPQIKRLYTSYNEPCDNKVYLKTGYYKIHIFYGFQENVNISEYEYVGEVGFCQDNNGQRVTRWGDYTPDRTTATWLGRSQCADVCTNYGPSCVAYDYDTGNVNDPYPCMIYGTSLTEDKVPTGGPPDSSWEYYIHNGTDNITRGSGNAGFSCYRKTGTQSIPKDFTFEWKSSQSNSFRTSLYSNFFPGNSNSYGSYDRHSKYGPKLKGNRYSKSDYGGRPHTKSYGSHDNSLKLPNRNRHQSKSDYGG